MGKKKATNARNTSVMPHLYRTNLTKRNQALLYVLVGFSFLLYLITFVRLGQW